MAQAVKCGFCGKEFIAAGHRKRFCSEDCKSRFYGDIPLVEKICPQCGKLFETHYVNKIFCSAKCYLDNNSSSSSISFKHKTSKTSTRID